MVRVKDTNIEIDMEQVVNKIKESHDEYVKDVSYSHVTPDGKKELALWDVLDELYESIEKEVRKGVVYD